ncbi:MAG: hypothetical protein CVU39_25180 [Chloroflexi bacterium HGW-Chloroflexi-10]|nr:MAG: hypothetical protein CVU39_25180 [Chloroflexi bacterium HGW-Chloroflexi-10]
MNITKPERTVPTMMKNWIAPNNKPTVGFLLASLHTGSSRALLPGLIHAAEEKDVNIICFPGGRLRNTNAYEIKRNVIYDLAGKDCVDGLITWSSSLGGVLSPTEINAFHERYEPLPLVSLAQFMEGIPTVSVDSYHGMRDLLAHLIDEHGYTKLAFIRGPEEHYYAQERYRAYLDTLQDFHLPLIPDLITSPLRWEMGAEAIQILLDERHLVPGKDFHAIVTVSDLMALWALKTLQSRGFRVPDDVAVTGFNNSIEERLSTPPLTTVDLPFRDQGSRAVDVLLALWNEQKVPALLTLPSSVVVRQSCGCPSLAVANAIEELSESNPGLRGEYAIELLKGTYRTRLLQEMAEAVKVSEDRIETWILPIYTAFHKDLEMVLNGSFSNSLIQALEEVLDFAMREKVELVFWHGLLSILRRNGITGLSLAQRVQIEMVFSQARVVISEAIQRGQAYWQWIADRQADVLRETTRALLTTFDFDNLAAVLVERLPRLGIPSAYLVIYENPSQSLEYARMILAYSETGPLKWGVEGRLFPAQELLPRDLLPKHRRYSFVVEPLFFQDRALGYVVFEIGPHEGDVYELLRANLSSAIQGALLFQEIQLARIQAEKADQIKTRLLANVSHELRTPLNIIIRYAHNASRQLIEPDDQCIKAVAHDLDQIYSNAEHQLRVINDLLDLSRAEIDELDLNLELLDPHPLLSDAFFNIAESAQDEMIQWDIKLPSRLPVIRADAVRLRQIILNLLSNARKFTSSGKIELGADVSTSAIHIWVSDTGRGVPLDQQEKIFEPFVTYDHGQQIPRGIGLGLSITRHLISLHGGKIFLESELEHGTIFHIHLPLPAFDQKQSNVNTEIPRVILVVSSTGTLAEEIRQMAERQKLSIRLIAGDEVEVALSTTEPLVVAWDLANAEPNDWAVLRRIRQYPRLAHAPFIVYGQIPSGTENEGELAVGFTSFLDKSSQEESLMTLISSLSPANENKVVFIVDDDPQVRTTHQSIVKTGLPDYRIKVFENGLDALTAMKQEVPSLVLLDLVMPGMEGIDVLEKMRANAMLRSVPVIILSNKILSIEDVRRMEKFTRVTFQNKGLWSDDELISAFNRVLFGSEELPAHTSVLVKKAIAFMHQNYGQVISRWQVAEEVGVSEDYFSRVFNRELGLSPWEYLNRYRVQQARMLLQYTDQNIGVIALQVGIKDQAYFSRVFHKITGVSPQAFRESLK